MRRSALAALLLLCSACGVLRSNTDEPYSTPRRVGVVVPASKGRCTSVVIGVAVRRVCLPRGKPQPADTAARDTTRRDPRASSAAAGGR